jgi:hypothetical protein
VNQPSRFNKHTEREGDSKETKEKRLRLRTEERERTHERSEEREVLVAPPTRRSGGKRLVARAAVPPDVRGGGVRGEVGAVDFRTIGVEAPAATHVGEDPNNQDSKEYEKNGSRTSSVGIRFMVDLGQTLTAGLEPATFGLGN